ncbi:hypothetical protein [Allochromatium vinosum]|uniref:hypothetical protein n=1 Tax=Allochromatium vinosum TaxID=1049 RepID=UPI001908E55E|nr:hypothetical protein [Allochromatium vinosum]MBK1656431.1 hypothetical protein [Allochromatium vinosum]
MKISPSLRRRYALAVSLTGLAFPVAASDALLTGLERTITWNHPENIFAESVLDLEFDTAVKPDTLIIKRATQAGMDYRVVFEALSVASNLPVEFDGTCIDGDRSVSGGGEVAESCFVQAGTHDFDADGLPELIIALGDGRMRLEVNVFSYHPPARPADAIRPENWGLIGHFSGQSNAVIDGQSVALPFGSQGFEQKMVFVDGRFIESAPQ